MFSLAQSQLATRTYTVDEVISNYTPVFYAAFVVTFVFTPLMRAAAIHYGIIDHPDRVRKMHAAPVAYLGGVAVFLGWLTGLTLSQYLRLHRIEPGWPTTHPRIYFSIVIGALIIVTLGLWDDVLKLRPWVKIAGQVFAAICLLCDGIGFTTGPMMVSPLANRIAAFVRGVPTTSPILPDWLVTTASVLLVIGIVVGCCNASNLLDGLDGLCGGVTAIISAGFLCIAVYLAMVGGGIHTNWEAIRVILGLALLGAVLGFIPFNFNPASIFMGDCGSMFLGFACAIMIILLAQDGAKWFLASLVIFALPVLDTALAFARRSLNRQPIFTADKHHFHHQLMARGLSVRQTVFMSYGLTTFFGLLGVGMVFLRTRYALAIYLVTFGSIIVAACKLGMVHVGSLTRARAQAATRRSAPSSGTAAPSSIAPSRSHPEMMPAGIAEPNGPAQ